jgi:hypothetical protein
MRLTTDKELVTAYQKRLRILEKKQDFTRGDF